MNEALPENMRLAAAIAAAPYEKPAAFISRAIIKNEVFRNKLIIMGEKEWQRAPTGSAATHSRLVQSVSGRGVCGN
jgi:hypothetical protein